MRATYARNWANVYQNPTISDFDGVLAMAGWAQVRKAAGVVPILEGDIGGETPMHVERFLRRVINQRLPKFDSLVLITILGGVRVEGGSRDGDHFPTLPGGSVLIPPNCKTEWHRPGTIDFAAFIFPERPTGIQEKICSLVSARGKTLSLTDPLVSAATVHIIDELQKGPSRDDVYLSKLSLVMLEQVYRSLAIPEKKTFNPSHVHHARMQSVLDFVHQNLGRKLSAKSLAARAAVSEMYFRHLFKEAVGMPIHRYILMARLELARKLLTTTNTPISKIALMCGFNSQSHLTSSFRATHAATPAEFRANVK